MRKKITTLSAVVTISLAASPAYADQTAKLSPYAMQELTDSDVEELPEWFKDSERLSQMLGGKVAGEVTNAKVIRRVNTPIAGLDAIVIKGTIRPPEKAPYEDIFTLYMDKANRYLVAGMMVDTKENRDMGTMISRYVKGEDAETPARALDVMSMSRLTMGDRGDGILAPGTLLYVSDFAQPTARQNLTLIHNLRSKLLKEGKPIRPFAVIPVSEGKDEMSSVASSMAFGYNAFTPGEGYNKIIEYAAKGKKAEWLSPQKIRSTPRLVQIVGLGIQSLDNNSSAALLARVNSLPLVYVTDGESAHWQPLPISEGEWAEILIFNQKEQK